MKNLCDNCDNILNKINVLLAKLKPSQYREYWKVWNAKFRDRYRDIFGDKYRLYFDYPTDGTEEIYPEIDTIIQKINKFFTKTPYTDDFKIRNIKDYIEGYAYKNGENKKIKIGKLLNNVLKYLEKSENNSENNPKKEESIKKFVNLRVDEIKHLLKEFNNRPSYKQIITNKLVCISRHPYDIAGMSTDRRWTSCMRLEDKEKYIGPGSYAHMIGYDIKEGTLIAYLIDENDKNINDPLARILIKPYINTDDPKDILLVPEPTTYSDKSLSHKSYDKFRQVVENWLESFQNKKKGTYTFNSKLYQDYSPQTVHKISEEKFKEIEKYISVDSESSEKSLRRILNMYPFIADGKFEDLVIYVKGEFPKNSYLFIKSGIWKDGVLAHVDISKDVVIEQGYIYESVCSGRVKGGIFCKVNFYGIFENGVWLNGTFNSEAVWKNGKWKVGIVLLQDKNNKEFMYQIPINPSIGRRIAEKSDNRDDFAEKYKKYFLSEYSDNNLNEKIVMFENYEQRLKENINKYERYVPYY